MLEICLEVAPCSCFCSGGKHNLFLKIYSILNDQIDDASLGAYVLAIVRYLAAPLLEILKFWLAS
jgi:hypothetical protein